MSGNHPNVDLINRQIYPFQAQTTSVYSIIPVTGSILLRSRLCVRSTQDRTSCMAPANTIVTCGGSGGLWGPLILVDCVTVLAVIEEERESEIKVMPMFSRMALVQKKATLNHMAADSTKINVRKPLFFHCINILRSLERVHLNRKY